MNILNESSDVPLKEKNQLKGRGCSSKICLEAYQTHSVVLTVATWLIFHSVSFYIESFLKFKSVVICLKLRSNCCYNIVTKLKN